MTTNEIEESFRAELIAFLFEYKKLREKRKSILKEMEDNVNEIEELSNKHGIPFDLSTYSEWRQYTPASFFSKFVRKLKEHDEINLSEIAHDLGYHDGYIELDRLNENHIGWWSSERC